MVITPFTALMVALVVAFLVAVAEWIHRGRIRRVAFLAFGPSGRAAWWTSIAAPLRVVAAGCATWGLLMLIALNPEVRGDEPVRESSRHLLIALDVSPSMQLVDSGPDSVKLSRAAWAGRLVQGILDRLDSATTRVSLVAFYTEARPVLTETFDKEVVSNVLDGLPMYTAFPSGGTKLIDGVTGAFEVARSWMPGTATLLVVSDGDALGTASAPRTPAAIADTIVIGVGDPYRTMPVGGHDSRQDTASLKQLALRLGGTYHQGNEKQVPSELIDELTMVVPRIGDGAGLRELALILSVLGASGLALIGPALSLAGRPITWSRARRRSASGVTAPGGAS